MKEKDVLWTKGYLLLLIANFFSWLSYNMVTPVLTGYVENLGASLWICGLVGGLFAFTSCLSRPISGFLSDTRNRKRLMAGSNLLMAVSLLIYAVVPSIPVILIFRGIHGVAFGISSTASLVLVSESVSERRIGEAVSYYGVMSVASMAIGPGIGIWCSEILGYQYCLIISTVILFAAGGAAVFFPYKVSGPVKTEKVRLTWDRLIEPGLIGLGGVNASFTMMNGVVSSFLVLFAAQRGIQGISLHFTLNAVVLILSRVILAGVMNSWSLKQNLYPAFFTGIAALVVISQADTLGILLLAAVLKAFAQGLSQPALQTEALKRVEPEKRGVACSTMYIGGDLGQAVGPMLGGVVAQRAGYGNMYLLSAVPLVIALICFFIRCRRDILIK